MKNARKPGIPKWLRLDNAAKIYPSIKSHNWTPVYRLSVTLREEIDEGMMRQALHNTLARIPLFAYRLRQGFFWFYLDRQVRTPEIAPDVVNPCAHMPLNAKNPFLFRVRVWKSRIAIEIFHALCDGAGGMTFLLTMAAEYLRLKYRATVVKGPYILDCRDTPQKEEWEDSFLRYARRATRSRQEERAFTLRGTYAGHDDLRVITGMLPTQKLYDTAKRYGATVNVFLAALLLDSLRGPSQAQASARLRARPIKVSLPVNLRRFYPSVTLRNFSSYINASLYPSYGDYKLEEIISQVKGYAAMELVEPMLNARFSANVAAEQSKVLRMAPLFIKTWVLRLMYRLTGERYFTTTLSNLGVIDLPQGIAAHIERADFIIGAGKRNPCSCGCLSLGGTTYLNFSRTILETDFERAFFRSLIRLGIPVKVESNWRDTECLIASTAG